MSSFPLVHYETMGTTQESDGDRKFCKVEQNKRQWIHTCTVHHQTQVHSLLQNRASKRTSPILNLGEISPRLMSLRATSMPIPGEWMLLSLAVHVDSGYDVGLCVQAWRTRTIQSQSTAAAALSRSCRRRPSPRSCNSSDRTEDDTRTCSRWVDGSCVQPGRRFRCAACKMTISGINVCRSFVSCFSFLCFLSLRRARAFSKVAVVFFSTRWVQPVLNVYRGAYLELTISRRAGLESVCLFGKKMCCTSSKLDKETKENKNRTACPVEKVVSAESRFYSSLPDKWFKRFANFFYRRVSKIFIWTNASCNSCRLPTACFGVSTRIGVTRPAITPWRRLAPGQGSYSGWAERRPSSICTSAGSKDKQWRQPANRCELNLLLFPWDFMTNYCTLNFKDVVVLVSFIWSFFTPYCRRSPMWCFFRT